MSGAERNHTSRHLKNHSPKKLYMRTMRIDTDVESAGECHSTPDTSEPSVKGSGSSSDQESVHSVDSSSIFGEHEALSNMKNLSSPWTPPSWGSILSPGTPGLAKVPAVIDLSSPKAPSVEEVACKSGETVSVTPQSECHTLQHPQRFVSSSDSDSGIGDSPIGLHLGKLPHTHSLHKSHDQPITSSHREKASFKHGDSLTHKVSQGMTSHFANPGRPPKHNISGTAKSIPSHSDSHATHWHLQHQPTGYSVHTGRHPKMDSTVNRIGNTHQQPQPDFSTSRQSKADLTSRTDDHPDSDHTNHSGRHPTSEGNKYSEYCELDYKVTSHGRSKADSSLTTQRPSHNSADQSSGHSGNIHTDYSVHSSGGSGRADCNVHHSSGQVDHGVHSSSRHTDQNTHSSIHSCSEGYKDHGIHSSSRHADHNVHSSGPTDHKFLLEDISTGQEADRVEQVLCDSGMVFKQEVLDPGYDTQVAEVGQSGEVVGGQSLTCQVCGDVSAGFHCGSYVCEACKKFFVRCVKSGSLKFTCPREQQCVINRETRTQCQYCRYQKCLALGMYKPGGTNVSSEISHMPCSVCGAPSSGFHFGAITCEGCKGFFRRTVKERDTQKYHCGRGSNCTITTATRNVCKYCRYKKCLEVGMKADGSRIGRQPNSVKHATMLQLQQIKLAKGLSVEFDVKPQSVISPPHSLEGEWVGVKAEELADGKEPDALRLSEESKETEQSESEDKKLSGGKCSTPVKQRDGTDTALGTGQSTEASRSDEEVKECPMETEATAHYGGKELQELTGPYSGKASQHSKGNFNEKESWVRSVHFDHKGLGEYPPWECGGMRPTDPHRLVSPLPDSMTPPHQSGSRKHAEVQHYPPHRPSGLGRLRMPYPVTPGLPPNIHPPSSCSAYNLSPTSQLQNVSLSQEHGHPRGIEPLGTGQWETRSTGLNQVKGAGHETKSSEHRTAIGTGHNQANDTAHRQTRHIEISETRGSDHRQNSEHSRATGTEQWHSRDIELNQANGIDRDIQLSQATGIKHWQTKGIELNQATGTEHWQTKGIELNQAKGTEAWEVRHGQKARQTGVALQLPGHPTPMDTTQTSSQLTPSTPSTSLPVGTPHSGPALDTPRSTAHREPKDMEATVNGKKYTSSEVMSAVQNAYRELMPVLSRNPDIPTHLVTGLTVLEGWDVQMKQFSQCAHATLKFAKKIPGFKSLPIQDQVRRVQESMYPIVLTLLSTGYDLASRQYNYFNMTREEEEVVLNLFPEFRALVPTFHMLGFSVRTINLDNTEVAFLCALKLLSEVEDQYLEDLLVTALERYCEEKEMPMSRAGEVILRLGEMARVNIVHQKTVIGMSPRLIKEGLQIPQLFEETFLNAD